MKWNVPTLPVISKRNVLICAIVAIFVLGSIAALVFHSLYTSNSSHPNTGAIGLVSKQSSKYHATVPTQANDGSKPAANQSAQPSGGLGVSSSSVTTSNNSSAPIAFTLSQTSITLKTSDKSPIIRATTTNGKAIDWAVFAGSGIMIDSGDSGDYGITSINPEKMHSFTFNPSPAVTKPGTYIITVEGYVPRGPKLDEKITVHVTQGITFTLAAKTPDYAYDTATDFYVPLNVEPYEGVKLGPLTASATLVSYTGTAPIQIRGVVNRGGSYYIEEDVDIWDNGQANGHLVVRVTVSDGAYTTSIDIPYDVQTQQT